MIDEFTRECPAIVVERSIDADAVVAILDRLAAQRGAPAFVRFDNGPEFIAHAVADWCRFNDVATVFTGCRSRARSPAGRARRRARGRFRRSPSSRS